MVSPITRTTYYHKVKVLKERRNYFDKAIERRKGEEVDLKQIADVMKEQAEELKAVNAEEYRELKAKLNSELLDIKEQNKILV